MFQDDEEEPADGGQVIQASKTERTIAEDTVWGVNFAELTAICSTTTVRRRERKDDAGGHAKRLRRS